MLNLTEVCQDPQWRGDRQMSELFIKTDLYFFLMLSGKMEYSKLPYPIREGKGLNRFNKAKF